MSDMSRPSLVGVVDRFTDIQCAGGIAAAQIEDRGLVFFQIDDATLVSLRWPWGSSDGDGATRLLLSYALILLPSALWLESTIFHLDNNYSWTPILAIGMLFLTSVGNIMLGLLAYGAYQDGVEGSGLMMMGLK